VKAKSAVFSRLARALQNGSAMKNAAPTLLFALAFAACGKAGAPSGPHGGDNTFDVTLAGEAEDFDEVSLVLSSSSAADLFLAASGSVDPQPSAIDDEYAIDLDVHLDRAALAQLSLPATITVKGTTRVPAGEVGVAVEDTTFVPDSTSSPIVKGVLLSRSCFCAPFGASSQSFEGTITVTTSDQAGMQGSLHLDVTGQIPSGTTSTTSAVIDLAFDLPVTTR
jgi:hypothetical protein